MFIKVLEVQIDEKPNGCVIRINDAESCIIRICGIPKELVYENGEIRETIDIAYPDTKKITI
jgi:hypothetical protein